MSLSNHQAKDVFPSGADETSALHRDVTARILASTAFSTSPRLRSFLSYIVDCSLANQAARLSEPQIGTSVFGREPGYNPGDDNIVRTQARLLRARLEAYFATEGKAEPLILEIPKGGYRPVFRERAESQTFAPEYVPLPVVEAKRPARWTYAVLAFSFLLLGWIVGSLSSWTDRVAAGESARFKTFWDRLLLHERPLTLVTPDVALALTSEILGRDFSLADYLVKKPKQEWAAIDYKLLRPMDIPNRNYTMMDAVSIAAGVAELASRRGKGISIRHARELGRRDLSGTPVVLIGNANNNPWLELFVQRMSFSFDTNNGRRPRILRNRQPREGELAQYVHRQTAGMNEGYSVISLRSGLDGRAGVLILIGMSMEATEAAADLVLKPALLEKYVSPLITDRNSYFEIVVKTRNLAGTSTALEVVAVRTYPD